MSRTINGTHTECVHCAVHCRALVLILIMVPIFCTRCCRVCIWNLNISSIWFLLSNFKGWFFFSFSTDTFVGAMRKRATSPNGMYFRFRFSMFNVIWCYLHISLLSSRFLIDRSFFTSLTFASQMRTIHVFLKHSFAKWSVIVMILWHPYFHPTNAQRECA